MRHPHFVAKQRQPCYNQGPTTRNHEINGHHSQTRQGGGIGGYTGKGGDVAGSSNGYVLLAYIYFSLAGVGGNSGFAGVGDS